ncbi:MAG: 2-C-methyl-D-erythritol 4-phosphate cytidylyltransferase, partial [Gemmatimonadota bacterium]
MRPTRAGRGDGTVRAAVVVPAGGAGRRMGGERKPYLELGGEPVLVHALRPFLERPEIGLAVVALPSADADAPPAWLTGLDARIEVVAGGRERSDSVRNALEVVPEAADVVLIHDAARPLVSAAVVDRVLRRACEGLAEGVGVIAAIPAADTIKEVDAAGRILRTPERSSLRRAQTPQAFPRGVIVEAHRRAREDGIGATDDAALVERCGGTVVVVDGEPENLKVTTPADLAMAEAL